MNQNYPDYPVGETKVDSFWLFIYIYIYIYIEINRSVNEFKCGNLGFILYNYALHVFRISWSSSGG